MGTQISLILDNLSVNQKKAALSRKHDVIVRAGAGSGKTKTLVARYLLLLDENRDWKPEDITAVTFTKKAAREMQGRIRQQMLYLASVSGNSDDQQFWLQKLSEMDSACIGTIHSLYSRILRAHPAECGLDPEFNVLDGTQSGFLCEDTADAFLSEISGRSDCKWLHNYYDNKTLKQIFISMLGNRSRINRGISIPQVDSVSFLNERVHYYFCESDFSRYIEEYRKMMSEPDYDKKADKIADNLRALVQAFDESAAMYKAGEEPLKCLNNLYKVFPGWSFTLGNTKIKANAKRIRDVLEAENAFLKDRDHDFNWYKEKWQAYDLAEKTLRELWPELKKTYLHVLDLQNSIDFEGLETLTLQLLRENEVVRKLWQSKIKSLLVDEFQDTNEAQLELFSLLDPEHDRLFAVGDKKQSIYGFRGTNVALFDQLAKAVAENGGDDILLDVTYRTDTQLLRPMGKMLETVMADDELNGLPHYAAYEPMQSHKASGKDAGPVIELLLGQPLPGRMVGSDYEIAAQVLAKRLWELKDSGKLKSWGDAAVLCRKSNDFRNYETAFTAWKIPYVTVAGKGFYDRPEIREIKNMLSAAENPFDNAALSGFLMNACIGFTPDMLARLFCFANSGAEKCSFHSALMNEKFHFDTDDKQKKLERARNIFSKVNNMAGKVPVDEVLEELYRLTGVRNMLAKEKTDRAWMNLDKLLSDARHSGIASVSEFLKQIGRIEDSGAREGEAPADNEGAVQIMTIHQAKGLEFPITIVGSSNAGMGSHRSLYLFAPDDSVLFRSSPETPRFTMVKQVNNEIEKSEWLRLFYVAATRAENRLIISGNSIPKNSKSDSWLTRIWKNLPKDFLNSGSYLGPAFEQNENVLLVQTCSELNLPDENYNEVIMKTQIRDLDDSLIGSIPSTPFIVKAEDHSFELTVGKMVHKGIELWTFPDEKGSENKLHAVFEQIMLQSERLSESDRLKAVEKSLALLRRFRESDVFSRIEKTKKRWHELPFSLPTKTSVINGVIDLLLIEQNGYTVIDFKTDALNSLAELSQAVQEHEKQLNTYRRAVRMATGVAPQLEICFLDYCGMVRCEPIGKQIGEEFLVNSESDFFVEEEPLFDDYWDLPPIPDPVDLDKY